MKKTKNVMEGNRYFGAAIGYLNDSIEEFDLSSCDVQFCSCEFLKELERLGIQDEKVVEKIKAIGSIAKEINSLAELARNKFEEINSIFSNLEEISYGKC